MIQFLYGLHVAYFLSILLLFPLAIANFLIYMLIKMICFMGAVCLFPNMIEFLTAKRMLSTLFSSSFVMLSVRMPLLLSKHMAQLDLAKNHVFT